MSKWIIILAALGTLSAGPSDSTDRSSIEIKCLYDELEIAKQEIKCYEDLLKSNSIINTTKKKLKHRNSTSKTKERKSFKEVWNSIFHIDRGVDMDLKDKLKNALENCDFPGKCIITSGLRPQCKSSQHSKGEAIDVSWKREGKEFGEWLCTTQGTEWLDTNQLSFYFENIRSKKGHPNYFYNKHAKGPHIHLYMKKNKKENEDRRYTDNISRLAN